MTSENASVYGGSQDTGYSSIRELKDFEKDPPCDDYMNSDPCVNDPDETSVIGLGKLSLYHNEKYGGNYNAGYVDIHQTHRDFSRDYENEKIVTAIIHTEYKKCGPGDTGTGSRDVYDTIESVGERPRGQDKLSVGDQKDAKNTVV